MTCSKHPSRAATPPSLFLLLVLAMTALTPSCLASTSRLVSITVPEKDDGVVPGADVRAVTVDELTFYIHEGPVVPPNWVARGNFSDQTFENGWAYLEIETRPIRSDAKQAYYAGVLEGYTTSEIIFNAWRNTMQGYCEWKGQDFCDRLRAFIKINRKWMDDMVHRHSAEDPLWYQVSLVLLQLEGLSAGYKFAEDESTHIPEEDLLWMNLAGDLEDLEQALKAKGSEVSQAERGDGHCSALIKLLPGNTDLYTSHVTWNSFQSMLRMQKQYRFPFQTVQLSAANRGGPEVATVPGHTVSFSSYPGVLHSSDDYYLLSSGLVTMETTIGNSNPDLWVNVKPVGELYEWIRVLVANKLAVDGKSWTKVFSKYNSGTYNNQWMIVDYNRFTPMKMIQPDTLWVLEQLPGLIVAADQSQHLQQTSYWPSYNSPFYPAIFNASGLPALVEKYGNWFSYDKTARALIFARDHSKVKDLGSMIKLMRYNNFQHDPLSVCDCDPPFSAENAISCRDDLNPANGTYPFGALGHRSHAGTDMKVTSVALVKKLEFLAVNGPTHDDLPVFKWSTSGFDNQTFHYGHPDVWDFPVVHRHWSFSKLSDTS